MATDILPVYYRYYAVYIFLTEKTLGTLFLLYANIFIYFSKRINEY